MAVLTSATVFQFLIGSLESALAGINVYAELWFQFLIGSLESPIVATYKEP